MKKIIPILVCCAAVFAQKNASLPVSTNYGAAAGQLNSAPFVQTAAGTTAVNALNCNVAGLDEAFDTTNKVNYLCTVAGSPGTWVPGVAANPYLCAVSAVSSIVCTHNLQTSTPWVNCYDSSGNLLGSSGSSSSLISVVSTSANVSTLTFSGTTTGTCMISTGGMGPTGPTGPQGPAGSGNMLSSVYDPAGKASQMLADDGTNGLLVRTAAGTTAAATASNMPSGVTLTIAGPSTQALSTGALAANTCATATNVTATGTLATDTVNWTPSASWSGLVGYGILATDGLIVYAWPQSGSINFQVCNPTSASITVPAASVNWAVRR